LSEFWRECRYEACEALCRVHSPELRGVMRTLPHVVKMYCIESDDAMRSFEPFGRWVDTWRGYIERKIDSSQLTDEQRAALWADIEALRARTQDARAEDEKGLSFE